MVLNNELASEETFIIFITISSRHILLWFTTHISFLLQYYYNLLHIIKKKQKKKKKKKNTKKKHWISDGTKQDTMCNELASEETFIIFITISSRHILLWFTTHIFFFSTILL